MDSFQMEEYKSILDGLLCLIIGQAVSNYQTLTLIRSIRYLLTTGVVAVLARLLRYLRQER